MKKKEKFILIEIYQSRIEAYTEMPLHPNLHGRFAGKIPIGTRYARPKVPNDDL